jgi:hypothetical protein
VLPADGLDRIGHDDAERLRERAAGEPIAPVVSFSEGLDALATGSRREPLPRRPLR